MPKTIAETIKAPDVTRFSRTIEVSPDALVLVDDSRRYSDVSVEEMMESLEANTQIQDILIRRGPNGEPWVTEGRRRVRAMRRYNELVDQGIKSPPKMRARCTVSDCESLQALIRAIAANHDRLNPSVIDDAYAVKLLLGYGQSREQITRLYHKSETWLSRLLAIGGLPVAVQERIHTGEIKAVAGYELSLHPPKRQNRLLAEMERDGVAVTVEEIRRRVAEWEDGDAEEPAEPEAFEAAEETAEPSTLEPATEDAVEPSAPMQDSADSAATQSKPRAHQTEPAPPRKPKRGRPRLADSHPRLPGQRKSKAKPVKRRWTLEAVREFFESQAGDADPWAELCARFLERLKGEISDQELEGAGKVACGVAK
jgi:ParB-like chromosome segregation protein Spo0J